MTFRFNLQQGVHEKLPEGDNRVPRSGVIVELFVNHRGSGAVVKNEVGGYSFRELECNLSPL